MPPTTKDTSPEQRLIQSKMATVLKFRNSETDTYICSQHPTQSSHREESQHPHEEKAIVLCNGLHGPSPLCTSGDRPPFPSHTSSHGCELIDWGNTQPPREHNDSAEKFPLSLLIWNTFTGMQRSPLNLNNPLWYICMSPICAIGLAGLNEHNLMFYRTRPPFMAERGSEGDLQFHTYSFATLSALCLYLWISTHHPGAISTHSGGFSFPLGRNKE